MIISPFPGLRPFTEEESLYFKGREDHVAKIQQELIAKRFLMVTGASGDGKSSLVYAGLLPNIRAGFIRGEFGRWAVAVFRPGHTPLENLSAALSATFGVDNSELKSQLKYGYSALADEYKKSALYLNKESEAYQSFDEKEKKKSERKASNLLIVVDQFEEFFTSDSNFNKETALPTLEAQLVMNLLLETTRLSQNKQLPVYIICTMRSDYIGNAPAYRGLPELIGNNQFFVPRLNRDELSRVIEEPALLHGNKITKRLTQRMINDLDLVNTDVLPSLQHALRQIWEHAGKGDQELDILHYSMAGGLNPEELPAEENEKYKVWFNLLPQYHKNLLSESNYSIGNILNLHANLLYEKADSFILESSKSKDQNPGINPEISNSESKTILRTIFQCLTQIDDNRAVRHRMTIAQVAAILKHKDTQIINKLLRIFRIQGNTLVYPFLLSENDLEDLPADTLLDITHEALIRNWKQLLQWTKEEYEDVQDYREFNKAMQRWKNGGKHKEYLLSQGSYDHFIINRKWEAPSVEWIKRYIDQSLYVSDGRAEKRIGI